jgi:hypothetical protein
MIYSDFVSTAIESFELSFALPADGMTLVSSDKGSPLFTQRPARQESKTKTLLTRSLKISSLTKIPRGSFPSDEGRSLVLFRG